MKLHVYDFDGTLFRSPLRPSWWPRGKAWWATDAALSPPLVPKRPSAEWWVSSVLSQAKRSISDPDTHTVLLTGRSKHIFFRRIKEIVQQMGLNFDELLLKTTSDDKIFKLKALKKLLEELPQIDEVAIWEDNGPNLQSYLRLVENMGATAVGHRVPARFTDVEDNPDLPRAASISKIVAYRVLGERYGLEYGLVD